MALSGGFAHRYRALRFALCAFFSVSLIGVTSCRNDPASFSRGLASIDAISARGDAQKALSALAKLRKKAVTVTNWLSIAKRERKLDDDSAAVVTLKKGLASYPSNQLLVAVLSDTLIDLERYDAVSVFREGLAGSPFSPLIAYAELMRTRASFPPDIDPSVWVLAYDASGSLACLDNAAVLYSVQGKNAEALDLATRRFSRDGAHPLFPALLSYDAGQPERVRTFLSRPDIDMSADELALSADAENSCGNAARSRELWITLSDRFPSYSPIAWYDRAITEPDTAAEKQGLENCLSLYPSYYPAVCRYVRNVSRLSVEEPDPVEKELRGAGFRTLEMEAADARSPVDSIHAGKALARALAASDDIRFKIEELRFNQLEKPDEGRTAAAMWKLIEKHPHDPVLISYAQWYFASIRQYDAAFGVGKGVETPSAFFWNGVEASIRGDLDAASAAFEKVADDTTLSWCALANLAKISERRDDLSGATEKYATAIELAPENRIKASLAYESAKIFVRLTDSTRARQMLGFALEFDPSFYAARAMLRTIESGS